MAPAGGETSQPSAPTNGYTILHIQKSRRACYGDSLSCEARLTRTGKDPGGEILKGLDIAIGILEGAMLGGAELTRTLSEAGEALGFDHFGLVHDDLSDVKAIAAEDMRAAAAVYQRDGWHKLDYRAPALAATPVGKLYVGNGPGSGDDARGASIYRDFFVPHRMAHCAAWRFGIAGDIWIFVLGRGETGGPVTPEETAALARLMPHANRALIAGHGLRQARIDGIAAFTAQVGLASVILDHSGRVAAVSPAAESLFGTDFAVRNGGLWAADSASQERLDALAACARALPGATPDDYVVVERTDGGWPILLRIMPIREAGLDLLPGGRLIITIEDRTAPLRISETELRLAYGLSHSEIHVAMLLAEGLTPREIAERRGVVIGTIRAQIREMFAKMGARRIADLVAILARHTRAGD